MPPAPDDVATLDVTVVEGRRLRNPHDSEPIRPFVRVFVEVAGRIQQEFQTATLDSANPAWEERFSFELDPPISSSNGRSGHSETGDWKQLEGELVVELYSEDRNGGETRISDRRYHLHKFVDNGSPPGIQEESSFKNSLYVQIHPNYVLFFDA
jgi:hypothetical protein